MTWIALIYYVLLAAFLGSAAVLCVTSVCIPDSKAYMRSLIGTVVFGAIWTGCALWLMASGVTL